MGHLRAFGLAVILASLAACSEVTSTDPSPEFGVRRFQDPLRDSLRGPDLEASYIVVFRPNVSDPVAMTDALLSTHGGRATQRYQQALRGFAAVLTTTAAEAIRRNPNVELVEPDGLASTMTGPQLLPPSWGLDRIDSRALLLDEVYSYQNDGAGVRVYILDTGVMTTHPEYVGRASSGWDFVQSDADASDCHGHGTHVAGTVAGATVGVAKAATIVAVRVLGCTGGGPWSQVIAGLDWVIANHVKPAVVNMSLGGSYTLAINTAVSNTVAAGVTVAVAAGNAGQDACSFSPASAPDALTVGATTRTDQRAPFSNFGSCVDLFAPGTEIYSSIMTGDYQSWSGTSMATPHVAGVAALYLAANPAATPAQVTAAILDGASVDRVTDALTTPNRLLYSQIAGDGVLPPLPPPPPPATDPSTELRLADLDGSSSPVRGGWVATVRVLVQNLNGDPIANAAVRGEWSEGTKGSGWCTTDVDGWCSIIKEGLKKGVASVRFSVYEVQALGKAYTAERNADPDGDSDGTQIVIRRP